MTNGPVKSVTVNIAGEEKKTDLGGKGTFATTPTLSADRGLQIVI